MKQPEETLAESEVEKPTELSEDIEVVGPGRMLRDARIALKLTEIEVAEKLNFRKTLVVDIEAEKFDIKLPATFHRGYLRNYAKLVNVSQEDILASYELLDDAKRQCAELQSFSKGTEKQAEHNLLMWITYLIIAGLIVATIMWWYQKAPVQSEVTSNTVELVTSVENSEPSTKINSDDLLLAASTEQALSEQIAQIEPIVKSEDISTAQQNIVEQVTQRTELTAPSTVNEQTILEHNNGVEAVENNLLAETQVDESVADVVFTFAGDCWVNIYDATGERVAWGVKKAGYVMRISGQAPFKVTLGKPELVEIEYNNNAIDMSEFAVGNIAKFSLPLKS